MEILVEMDWVWLVQKLENAMIPGDMGSSHISKSGQGPGDDHLGRTRSRTYF